MRPDRGRRHRRPVPVAAALVLAAAGAGCVAVGTGLLARAPALSVPDVAVAGPTAVAPVAPTPPRAPRDPSAAGAEVRPAARPAAPAVAGPARLSAPDVDVRAEVVPVGLAPDGALEIPPDPDVLGWWSAGAVPGAAAGATVVAAHVDAADAGTGPMLRLVEAPVGTVVDVTTTDGTTVTYRVVERRSYPKADGLPRDLFASDGPPRLVLITCGGVFDRAAHHYRDNVVLVATPGQEPGASDAAGG